MLTITPNPWIGLILLFESILLVVVIDGLTLISNYNAQAALKHHTTLQTLPSRAKYLWRRRRRLAKIVGGAVGSMMALSGFVYTMSGTTVWPSTPEVHPTDVVDDSSFRLGFVIKNSSYFFPIKAKMTCGIDIVALMDANGSWGGAGGIAFYTGIIDIPKNDIYHYPCDATALLIVRPDGSLTLRGTLNLPSRGPMRPPIKILKVCAWIGMDYWIGFSRWSYRSKLFKWPESQTVHKWVEGQTATDQDLPKQMPSNDPDDIQCRKEITPTYYFYVKGSNVFFLRDIDKRGQALDDN